MKMLKLSFLLVVTLISKSLSQVPAFPLEDNVVVLTDKTIDEAISFYPSLLIEFYAPWCPHCQHLAPHYAEAAGSAELKKLGVTLAKIDAEFNSKVMAKYHIRGFPSLIWFQNGERSKNYGGGRTKEKIISWFTKQILAPSEILTTFEDVEKYENSTDITLVYFGDNKRDIEIYHEYSLGDNNHEFGRCSDKKIMKKYKVPERTLVLFKPHDDRRDSIKGDDITKENIEKLIHDNKNPLILPMQEGVMQTIYEGHSGIFIFRQPNNQTDSIISKFAKKYKGKIQFVVCEANGDLESRLFEHFEMKVPRDDLSIKVALYDEKTDKKIKLEKKFSENNLKEFLADWESGKAVQHLLKSEPIPTTQGTVFKLVKDSFDKEVIKSNVDVFVKFYLPTCGHCKRLAPVWEELAKHYEKEKDKIIIAEFNRDANDFEPFTINGFPTLYFWKAGNKSKPILYSGDRSLSDLKKFVEENRSKK